jgi:hypothetical protein
MQRRPPTRNPAATTGSRSSTPVVACCSPTRACREATGHENIVIEFFVQIILKQADEYEFHADCERAISLALIARYQGKTFWTSEVNDIHFDEALARTCSSTRPSLMSRSRRLSQLLNV